MGGEVHDGVLQGRDSGDRQWTHAYSNGSEFITFIEIMGTQGNSCTNSWCVYMQYLLMRLYMQAYKVEPLKWAMYYMGIVCVLN